MHTTFFPHPILAWYLALIALFFAAAVIDLRRLLRDDVLVGNTVMRKE
jgi:hypothetical protein